MGIEQPIRAQPGVQFQPDLEMRFLNRSTTGLTVHYRFRLTNVGIDRADTVLVETQTYQRSYSGDDHVPDYRHYTIPTTAAGKSVDVVVDCTPKPGFVCISATAAGWVDWRGTSWARGSSKFLLAGT